MAARRTASHLCQLPSQALQRAFAAATGNGTFLTRAPAHALFEHARHHKGARASVLVTERMVLTGRKLRVTHPSSRPDWAALFLGKAHAIHLRFLEKWVSFFLETDAVAP